MTARVRRNEDEQTQSLSPSQVLKVKFTHPATVENWKLDWLGVEDDDDEKKSHIFFLRHVGLVDNELPKSL